MIINFLERIVNKTIAKNSETYIKPAISPEMLPVTIRAFGRDILGETGIGTLQNKSMEIKYPGTSKVPDSFSNNGNVTDTQDNSNFNIKNNKDSEAIEGYHDKTHSEPATYSSSEKGKVNINEKDDMMEEKSTKKKLAGIKKTRDDRDFTNDFNHEIPNDKIRVSDQTALPSENTISHKLSDSNIGQEPTKRSTMIVHPKLARKFTEDMSLSVPAIKSDMLQAKENTSDDFSDEAGRNVTINIGRIEVRAVLPKERQQLELSNGSSATSLSLEEYLKMRKEGRL